MRRGRRHRPFACFVACVASSACGVAVTAAPSDAGHDATREDAPDPCARAEWESWQRAEVYHRDDAVDEIHLALRDDGALRWSVYGCDFGSGPFEASWRATSPSSIRVEPSNGAPTLRWPSTWPHEFRWLELTRDPAQATLRVTAGDPSPASDRWRRGWVCAECGSRGPRALLACDGARPAQTLGCMTAPRP